MTIGRISQATWHQWTLFQVGLMFLTILPVGTISGFRPEWQVKSARYFWLIGVLIGGISATVAWLLYGHLSVWLLILAVLFTSVLVTGGLHEDALADAADGLLDGRTVEKRLEIMKDSRVGTYGVLALWFSLSAKWACLHDLALDHFKQFLAVVIVAPSLARISSVALLHFLPYVQSERSKGAGFARPTIGSIVLNLALGGVLSVVLQGFNIGLLCIGVMIFLTLSAGYYFHSKIGGISGDCLGATIQIVELGCYFAVLIFIGGGKS